MAQRTCTRSWTEEEAEIADEFLAHARAIRAERAKAAREGGRARAFIELLKHWGGVTIAYRRRLIDSPSYTLNHEEVEKALEEGIAFAECLTPEEVEVDAYGARQRRRAAHAGARRATANGAPAMQSRCRRARSSSPPAPSRTPCWRAKTPRMSRSTAATSRLSTRTATPRQPGSDLASRNSSTC